MAQCGTNRIWSANSTQLASIDALIVDASFSLAAIVVFYALELSAFDSWIAKSTLRTGAKRRMSHDLAVGIATALADTGVDTATFTASRGCGTVPVSYTFSTSLAS